MSASANSTAELFTAIEKDDEKTVKRLVEEGVSLTDVNKQTAAHVATHRGNLRLLRYFLQQNDELLYAANASNELVIHVAAKEGHLEILKYLLDELRVDVSEEKNLLKANTAIHIAAEEGHLPIIKYYLEERNPKGDPDLRNDEGATLMMSAAEKAQLPLVRYLVESASANATKLDYYDSNILYHSAVIGDLTVPKYILDERKVPLDPDWRNIFQMTVIFLAARFNRLDFIKYFIEQKNATVDIPNNMQWTPLHEAANEGHFEVVKYLIGARAGLSRREMHGETPAQVAKTKEIADYLHGLEKQRLEEYEEYIAKQEKELRSRRSVSEFFVRHSPHPQTPIPCRWIQNMIADQFWSPSSRSQRAIDGGHTHGPMDGISSLYLDSFLMLAGACAKYVRGVGYEPTKHQSLLSPHEMIRDRMDPIAFDAVDAIYDFEYPQMNNV